MRLGHEVYDQKCSAYVRMNRSAYLSPVLFECDSNFIKGGPTNPQ